MNTKMSLPSPPPPPKWLQRSVNTKPSLPPPPAPPQWLKRKRGARSLSPIAPSRKQKVFSRDNGTHVRSEPARVLPPPPPPPNAAAVLKPVAPKLEKRYILVKDSSGHKAYRHVQSHGQVTRIKRKLPRVVVEDSHANVNPTIAESSSVAEASSLIEEPPFTEAELLKQIIRTSNSDVVDSATTPLPAELGILEFNRKYNPKRTNTRHLSQCPGPVPSNFPTTFDPDAFLLHGDLKDVTLFPNCQKRLKEFETALEGKSIYDFKAFLV